MNEAFLSELRRLSMGAATPSVKESDWVGLFNRLNPEKKSTLLDKNTDAKLGLLDYMQFYSDDENLEPVSHAALQALPTSGVDVPFGYEGEGSFGSGVHGLYNQYKNNAYLPGMVMKTNPNAPAHEGLHSLAQNLGWLDMRKTGPHSPEGKSHHNDVYAVDYINEERRKPKDYSDTIRQENRLSSIYGKLLEGAPGESDQELFNRASKFRPGGIFSNY